MRLLHFSSLDCHLARMIPRHRFTLITVFMFLVYDNHSKIWKRRKQRGAGTDHNLYTTFPGLLHLIIAFPLRQTGMQNRNLIFKIFIKPSDCLIRQCNLRNEHNDLFSLLKNRLNQFHIDKCFAAACHSVNKAGATASVKFLQNSLNNHFLLCIGSLTFSVHCLHLLKRSPINAVAVYSHNTFFNKRFQCGRCNLKRSECLTVTQHFRL